MPTNIYRVLPSVDRLLSDSAVKDFKAPKAIKAAAARDAVDALRREITQGRSFDAEEAFVTARDGLLRCLREKTKPYYRRVINATGIVLHTNLGRAVLPESARRAVDEVMAGYSNLEFDLGSGKRGNRYGRIPEMLCALTGAEAALTVNNNAAAVLLAMQTFCGVGGEALISRGEMVEIGDSFRVPDLMESCGARLHEVGMTNRTYPRDYENAIRENTRVLWKIHTSNYAVHGFSRSVTTAELADIGKKHALPVLCDLGSGCLRAFSGSDRTPADELRDGADLVFFSGDKLLGGPQMGIIVGRADYISAMKKNPLMRALRADKLSLAALEATLAEHLDEETACRNIPTQRMLNASSDELLGRSYALEKELLELGACHVSVENRPVPVGGGSMPDSELAGPVVLFRLPGMTAEKALEALRCSQPPIVCFVRDERLIMDVRTMTDEEIKETADALRRIVRA